MIKIRTPIRNKNKIICSISAHILLYTFFSYSRQELLFYFHPFFLQFSKKKTSFLYRDEADNSFVSSLLLRKVLLYITMYDVNMILPVLTVFFHIHLKIFLSSHLFYILIREGIRFMQNGIPPRFCQMSAQVRVLRPSEPEK